jgi:hypothetical protein
MKTDGELITKSREMIDLTRRRLQQVPQTGTIYSLTTLTSITDSGPAPGVGG